MDVPIRDAGPEDAAAVVKILNAIIAADGYTVFDSPFTVAAEERYIAGLFERGIFHVAQTCIGRRLFEATFDSARQKGYEKIFTYVRGDNPAALAAYVKSGFRIVGTAQRHARIGGRYIEEIIVEKFL
jgi:L-amino acid N-acyltransferase YncA